MCQIHITMQLFDETIIIFPTYLYLELAPLAHPRLEGRDLHSGVPYQPYPLTQHISQTS